MRTQNLVLGEVGKEGEFLGSRKGCACVKSRGQLGLVIMTDVNGTIERQCTFMVNSLSLYKLSNRNIKSRGEMGLVTMPAVNESIKHVITSRILCVSK